MPKARKNITIEYDWVQYLGDDMYTIRRITTEDHYKVFTQGEAEAKSTK